jgi:hypothetical protein
MTPSPKTLTRAEITPKASDAKRNTGLARIVSRRVSAKEKPSEVVAKMVNLTDNQLIVLSKAAAREDGTAVLPLTMNRAAAVKVGSSLIGRKMMREIRSKPGMQVRSTTAYARFR